MFKHHASFKGGIHIQAAKGLTSQVPIQICPAPDYVYLPVSMHIGTPAAPLVQTGDKVYLGQKIAAAQGFVSSNIHASVSGSVEGFTRRFLPNGLVSNCIILKNDHLDTPDPAKPKPLTRASHTPETLRQSLQDNGIVGMGGATFPTHVKYAPPKGRQTIDTIIINGIECEPYITADHRVLLEYAETLIRGLKYFMQTALAHKGYLAIEENKPDAIELLTRLTAAEPDIKVIACAEKYPQGSEKHLVYAITGRTIPAKGLPASVGVILDNAATAVWAARAIEENRPCYDRVVTISGDAVNAPGNYLVRLGTLYSDAVAMAAQGYSGNLGRILSGGPMMGFSVNSLDFPVLKGTSAILLFTEASPFSHCPPEQNCVRCGHCVDVCPMFLEPTVIAKAVKRHLWAKATQANITACIECGSCAYSCPAHIPLVQYIRMGKQYIATDGFGGHNPLY